MAIKVEFEGWVNDSKTFEWGTVVKVSHDQRAKNQATGEWESVGKDYFDVTVTAEQLHNIAQAKVVKVVGTLKVGTYVKKDGSTGVALKVRALEISPVERGFAADRTSPARTVDEDDRRKYGNGLPF